MNVSPELDTRFRAAAVQEGLVDPFRRDRVAGRRAPGRGDPAGSAGLLHGRRRRRSLAHAFGVRVLRSPLDGVRRELDDGSPDSAGHSACLDLRVAPFLAGAARAGARALQPGRYLRAPRSQGRSPEGGARGRHGDEPEPTRDRAAVPPDRRRQRLAHRLRRRPRRGGRCPRGARRLRAPPQGAMPASGTARAPAAPRSGTGSGGPGEASAALAAARADRRHVTTLSVGGDRPAGGGL